MYVRTGFALVSCLWILGIDSGSSGSASSALKPLSVL